jgi:hypothetical protein
MVALVVAYYHDIGPGNMKKPGCLNSLFSDRDSNQLPPYYESVTLTRRIGPYYQYTAIGFVLRTASGNVS